MNLPIKEVTLPATYCTINNITAVFFIIMSQQCYLLEAKFHIFKKIQTLTHNHNQFMYVILEKLH